METTKDAKIALKIAEQLFPGANANVRTSLRERGSEKGAAISWKDPELRCDGCGDEIGSV